MANIFIAFRHGIFDVNNSNSMPCFYESFIKGFENEGNSVFVYHHNKDVDDNIPHVLLNQIKQFNPDVIFLFNNNFYDIADEFICPIVIYEVDSLIYYSHKEKIRKNPNRYKYFVPQTESIRILKDNFHIDEMNILYLPFFTSVQSEYKEQDKSISFIGSKFVDSKHSDACWEIFQKNKPNIQEILQFKNILIEIENNPFITKEIITNKFLLLSPNVLKNLDIMNLISHLSDSKRVQLLSEVADLGLTIYGTPNWCYLPNNPEVSLSYISDNVYSLKHNQDIYNPSKICINTNHIQAKTGFLWRVCDIMASNACLVSEYRSDFDILFPELNIPIFTNKFEARKLCIKLLKEDNWIKDIVAKCQEVIDSKYRFSHLCKNIEFFLGNGLRLTKQNNSITLIYQNQEKQKKSNFIWYLKNAFYSTLLAISYLPLMSSILKRDKYLKRVKINFCRIFS